MDWNPIEVTATLWPITRAKPFLVLAWILWFPLTGGVVLIGTHLAIRQISTHAGIPFLPQFTNWHYFGVTVFAYIMIALLLAIGLSFWSATKQPQSVQSPTTAPSEEATMQPPSNITQNIYGGNYGLVIGQLTIQGDQPRISLSDQTELELADRNYQYTSILNVQTTYVLPQLRVIARAPSVKSLKVTALRAGIQITGWSGERDGFHFTTIQNVAGQYRIVAVTRNPERVVIDLEG
ncbi:MAG: hypothetical protein HY680_01245 [Chloroflexi bacterium]|nr:hypothetical protein [Chloroflexota bacterium]